MKLDPTVMRTMDRKDFRVLEAVEQGMRTHALVPGPLVATHANLRHGGSHKIISSLLRDKLLSHESRKGGYDGYRLTNAGYDILALWNLKTRGFVAALGDRIGTGKESDVYLGCAKDGTQVVLKMHRLGRTSFRNVRQKRDYFNNAGAAKGQPNSWLFLSRLSAIKEFAFMKALHGVGYPTPTPVAHNRHVVVMSLVRGVPLYQLQSQHVSAAQAQSIFTQATEMAVRLAQHGLVHCDLNEFNLLVDMSGIQSTAAAQDDAYVRHSGMSVAPSKGALSGLGPWDQHYDPTAHQTEVLQAEEEAPPVPTALLEETGEPKPIVTLIDFPQMVSTQHPNAQELYHRDLECLRKFFVQKLQCRIPAEDLQQHLVAWDQIVAAEDVEDNNDDNEEGEEDDDGTVMTATTIPKKLNVRLDVELRASGYSVEDSKRDLELFYFQSNEQLMHSILAEDGEEEEEDSEEEGEDNEEEDEDDNGEDVEDAEPVAEKANRPSESRDEKNADSVPLQKEDNNPAVSSNTVKVDNDNDNNDNAPDTTLPDVENLLDLSSNNPMKDRERRIMEEKAKARVRQQLDEQKKKGKKKGAFRAGRNQNKRYVKGKRVMDDFGL